MIGSILVSIVLFLVIATLSYHSRRLTELEKRPWPQEVTEWKPVYTYNPNCRCSPEPQSKQKP